jgi:hypothetical protein
MALFLHKEAPFNGDLFFLGRSLNPPFRGDGKNTRSVGGEITKRLVQMAEQQLGGGRF